MTAAKLYPNPTLLYYKGLYANLVKGGWICAKNQLCAKLPCGVAKLRRTKSRGSIPRIFCEPSYTWGSNCANAKSRLSICELFAHNRIHELAFSQKLGALKRSTALEGGCLRIYVWNRRKPTSYSCGLSQACSFCAYMFRLGLICAKRPPVEGSREGSLVGDFTESICRSLW